MKKMLIQSFVRAIIINNAEKDIFIYFFLDINATAFEKKEQKS